MNILFSSDDNYAQHLGVAIYSLLEHNRNVDIIRVFVVDNDISNENKQKLKCVVDSFSCASIEFISFAKWRDSLHLDMSWSISISAYARLFVASILPENIHKVLYLDCDMIVCEGLEKLWNTKMNGRIVAAVQDTVSDSIKTAVGMCPTERYFNSGLLLIDLKAWRTNDCEQKCIRFIEDRNGNVMHHDQGVLNGIFHNAWLRLPLSYNLMTIHYLFSQKVVGKIYKDHASFYLAEEVTNALMSPVIIHFTPSVTTRPWVKSCQHPMRNMYWEILRKTPWKGTLPEIDKDKWYVKLINWFHRNIKWRWE